MSQEPSLGSPMWLPYLLEPKTGRLKVAKLNRDDYRRHSFVDPRRWHSGPLTEAVLEDVDPSQWQEHRRPSHYLFHTAYCGSTALVRGLESLSAAFVVKEPPLLDQVAMIQQRWPPYIGLDFGHWANLERSLHGRSWDVDESVVIKANSASATMGAAVLARGDSVAALIGNPLRFVFAHVKHPSRYREVVSKFHRLSRVAPSQPNRLLSTLWKEFDDMPARAVVVWFLTTSHLLELNLPKGRLFFEEELRTDLEAVVKRLMAELCLETSRAPEVVAQTIHAKTGATYDHAQNESAFAEFTQILSPSVTQVLTRLRESSAEWPWERFLGRA